MLQHRFQQHLQNHLQGYLLQARQAIQFETIQQQRMLPSDSQMFEERGRS